MITIMVKYWLRPSVGRRAKSLGKDIIAQWHAVYGGTQEHKDGGSVGSGHKHAMEMTDN